MTHEFTAVFEEAPEGGYTAFVEELPGAEANRELAMRGVDQARVAREKIVVNE